MYYQGQEIKTLYHQGRQITLLYYQGMVVYRIGGPGGETYAIINTLEDAKALLVQDIHFDWVWASDMNKWYRYNNIRQYEEYGIYADTIESYREDWVENDVPETSYQTPIIPTINTRMHIEGTLKHKNDALYYGYTNSDDNKDYRFFKAGNIAYWDMNSSRLNSNITNIKAGDFISMDIGNNFMRGKMGTYNINNATTNPLTTVAAPSYLNINLSAIDIDYFAIYENDEIIYEILKREDGPHYSRYYTTVGTTTYKGKLATVDGIEYQFDGNGWIEVGTSHIASAYAEPISGFLINGNIGDTIEYAASKSGSSLKYTLDNNISQFGIYLGVRKGYNGEVVTITASEPNSDVVLHKLERSDKVTFNKYYEYFTYDNLQAGDVITIKYTSKYDVSSWGGGYTYAPAMRQVDVPYDIPEPIKVRTYQTMAEFESDNSKYGDTIIVIEDTDESFLYTYMGDREPLSEYYYLDYTGSEAVVPTNFPEFVNSSFDGLNGRMLFNKEIDSIPENAFYQNTAIKSIRLTNHIESIYKSAFESSGLENIEFNGGLYGDIGENMFKLSQLNSIDLTNTSINVIPTSTFNSCSKLTTVALPESVTSFGSYAFTKTTLLKNLNFPTGVTSIPTECFYMSGIEELDNSSITYIGDSAFQSTSLKRVVLNNFKGTGGGNWFYSCKSLEYVNLGSQFVGSTRTNQFYGSPVKTFIFEDASKMTNAAGLPFFASVETLRMPGLQISVNMSGCTGLSEEALVQIFNDLATVTDKTLTIGETLLAKLTDEDIAIATGKGWTLA